MITPLPTPVPSRQDPENFAARADAFLSALPTFATEANDLAIELNQVEIDVQSIKSSAIAETQAIANQAQASADQSAGFASQAQAAFNAAAIQADIAASAANFKGGWQAGTMYAVGDSVVYQDERYLALRGNVGQTPGIATLDWFLITSDMPLIRTPTPINPVNGNSGVLPNVTLEASVYAPLYSADERTYRIFEVALSSDPNFVSPVFTVQIDADTVVVTPNLTVDSVFIWRCKDVVIYPDNSQIESEWMPVQLFTTANISVATPSVSVTGSPSDVPESPTITTSAFDTIPTGEDTHLSTDWEVRLASNNSLVWSSYNNTTNLVSIAVPAGNLLENTSYIFLARHNGNTYGASGYGSITATTAASFFDSGNDIDGLNQIVTIQAEYNHATTYSIGQVVVIRKGALRIVEYTSLTNGNVGNNPETSPSHWNMTFDNNTATAGYFGEIAGSACVVDRGEWNAATAYVAGNMVVIKTGAGNTQADLTAYVAKTSNTNKPPAANPADWEQRNGLPTGTSLAQNLGIGSTAPEVLVNNDSGWLKFVHKGKIKYIAKKPFMHSVSWNDLAKAEVVYGNRTVRIGSRLFRVSILTGAEADPSSWTSSSTATDNKGAGSEWNELIYRVHVDVPTGGATTNHGGPQVGANWHNFSNADIVVVSGDGRASWCQETIASNASVRVARGGGSLSGFSGDTSSYTHTGVGWRPCLTLISEPEADSTLYNAEASGAGPSVASLQYDPITDTGYYGEVAAANLYTGSGISTAVGLTAGTLQNDTEGWLKFYWHGMVLFIAKKTYRYNLSWDSINTAVAVYGVNLGSSGRKTVSTGGYSYDVKLMKGAIKDPSPESGGGRQWNELLYRVCTGTETGEIGANWATLNPSTDLGINSGNGSYTWCQETSASNASTRVVRGVASLSYFDLTTSSNTNTGTGWRPCLALVR